jgi:hypothetical protein
VECGGWTWTTPSTSSRGGIAVTCWEKSGRRAQRAAGMGGVGYAPQWTIRKFRRESHPRGGTGKKAQQECPMKLGRRHKLTLPN